MDWNAEMERLRKGELPPPPGGREGLAIDDISAFLRPGTRRSESYIAAREARQEAARREREAEYRREADEGQRVHPSDLGVSPVPEAWNLPASRHDMEPDDSHDSPLFVVLLIIVIFACGLVMVVSQL